MCASDVLKEHQEGPCGQGKMREKSIEKFSTDKVQPSRSLVLNFPNAMTLQCSYAHCGDPQP